MRQTWSLVGFGITVCLELVTEDRGTPHQLPLASASILVPEDHHSARPGSASSRVKTPNMRQAASATAPGIWTSEKPVAMALSRNPQPAIENGSSDINITVGTISRH